MRTGEAHSQELPDPPQNAGWKLEMHTACKDPFLPDTLFDGKKMELGARSAAIFVLQWQ